MIIGIIGAENSHTAAIAKIINVEEKVRGFSVDYLWGETEAFARKAAKEGRIGTIVKTPGQMLGKVDAVIVDHRHPRFHLKAVVPFIEKGLPVFVDKPFCFRSDEGKEFLKAAKKFKAPVTSFSTIVLRKSFSRFRRRLSGLGTVLAGGTYGPCDPKSPYGGIFFYGIHSVEMALAAFGYDVSSVNVVKSSNGAAGLLSYPSGLTVSLHLVKDGTSDFAMSAAGGSGGVFQTIDADEDPYLGGVMAFTRMFKTGKEPRSGLEILKPIQVLEAMEESYKLGGKVRVR